MVIAANEEGVRGDGKAGRGPKLNQGPSSAPLEDSRELGEIENLTFQMHQLSVLTAAGVLSIRGPLTQALVRRALDWLQQEHSMLRAHLVRRGVRFTKAFPFVYPALFLETRGTPQIPLLSIVDADPKAVDRLLFKELNTPIPLKDPRMRVVLLRPGETADTSRVIISVDHTVADAVTASMVIRQLLEFLADPDAAPAPRGVDERLPPALETIAPKKSDSGTNAYIPIIRLPLGKLPRSNTATLMERRRFSRAETGLIKEKIKAHRVTMHGLVAASLLKAINEHFGLDTMTVLSTAEFRAQGKPRLPPDTFGCYVDLLRTKHKIDVPLWPLAQDVALKLITTLIRDQANASVFKRPSWKVYQIEAVAMFKSRWRNDGLVMTTAGETGVRRDYGPFVLEDMFGLVSQSKFGAGVFGVAQEHQGALELTLCYAAHCLSQQDAARLADMATATLRNLPD